MEVSPMKQHVLEQKARIDELLSNAQLFKDNYQDLTQNIITSLNRQLKQYSKDGKKSINIDIFNLTVEAINWEDLQSKIAEMLKSKKPNVNPGEWKKLSKPTVGLEMYDDDAVTNMILNCDVEHVKEFQKYRKLAKNELNELLDSVEAFEQGLCDYRAAMVQRCLENVNFLFNCHFNYVNDVLHKKETKGSIIIDGKEVELKKSQKEFITNALKTVLGVR